jgi:glycosyltransferase involved in cell wall biosynthesis
MALRVLAVVQAAELGGAELALLRLVPALRADGVEVELGVPADGGVARAGRDLDLPVHELPVGSLRRGGWPRAVLGWPRTHRVVRRLRPDVVWLNGVVPGRLVPALGGTPAVLHLHDLLDRPPRAWRSRRFWRTVRAVACASDAVGHAAAAAGAPSGLLRTLPVPVERVERAPRPPWAGDGDVVGFVGRLEHRKGVLDLLAAMAELRNRVPRARLVIVRGPRLDADPDYERRVEQSVERLGEAALVVGPVPDARALMPWFDVLCVPSLVEPFGTVAAEALAAGTPAVVTASGGMTEYVVPGVNGEVVPPGDPAALALALAAVLPRAAEMREAARESAERFGTERAGHLTAALLREAAGS